MNNLEFNFSEASFNRLFPFYILIDNSLSIENFGKGLAKLCPEIKNSMIFIDCFTIKRPHLAKTTFQEIINIGNQLVVIESLNNDITLRGQFEQINNSLLFVGSPWFNSMDQVIEKKLTLHDFAIHDPLIDLLHVLKNSENTSQELKELLKTINDQKNKLKKDQEELNRLSLVASINKNGVVFTKSDGMIFWCNDAFLNQTGYSREEVIGRNPIEVGQCEFTDIGTMRMMTDLFFKGKPFEVELIHGKKDGSYFWTRTTGQPLLNPKGEVIQYYAIIEDISEQKQSSIKLIESENRLATLILNLETAMLLEDENRKIVLSNKKFCAMFGMDIEPEFLIGLDCSNSAEESKKFFKSPEKFVKRIDAILKEKKAVHHEELELVDGRFFERSFIPIYKDGNYNGHLWTYDDITLKKRYDESLEIEKNKYQSIIANMNLGLIEVDLNDTITLANKSFTEISGYSYEELISKKASDLLLTVKGQEIINSKNELRTQGVTDSYEVKVINKKGEKRNWLISGAPNYDFNGNVIGSIGIHLDITEQKEQEEQLYLLSLIAEKNINAVVIADAEGNIEWANTSFLKMSGFAMEELVGKNPGKLLQGAETNPETVRYLKEKISNGLPFNCEIINYSKTGKKYWVSIRGQALYNKKNEIVKFFAIQEDITSKKHLEEQQEELVENLAKSNKELEDYAQIVSHDLKSPLRSIHSLITWIKEDNDKEFNDKTLKYLSMVENKVEKMDHLIEGILTYSKIDKVNLISEQVNTYEIVQNIINIIHIPAHIKVIVANDLPVIKADRFRIQQLFQNIISNAVSYNDKPNGTIQIDWKMQDNNYLFSIKDNGPGIAKKNHEKIFQIFQSLNNNSKSTGLGLSIVKKIIDTYNGTIWIESEIGQGTTFYFTIPRQHGAT